MMSMHKLVAGDGYAYLTRHVTAGYSGPEPGASLAAYYEAAGPVVRRRPCRSGDRAGHRVRDRVSEEPPFTSSPRSDVRQSQVGRRAVRGMAV